MKKNFVNNDEAGFSLVEVLIAAGIVGVVALATTKVIYNLQSASVVSESKIEELEIRRVITTTLASKEACTYSIGGRKIGDAITVIKNNVGGVLFESGKTYGNNTVLIEGIRTVDKNEVSSDGTKIIDLVVKMRKIKKLAKQEQGREVSIPLRISSPSGTSDIITDCFSNTESLIAEAVKYSCLSGGGNWNPNTKTCAFPQYLLKAGDSMLGHLGGTTANFTGEVTAQTVTSPTVNGTNVVVATSLTSSGGNSSGFNQMSASTFVTPSDRRLKTDIKEMKDVLTKVKDINIYSFKYKKADETHFGVVAQDVQKIYPELVVTGDDGFLSVKYTEFIPVLIKGMQEQQAKIKELEAEIKRIQIR
nr:tail fiber domain-containing protein [Bacteriovorax sp. HI3]